MRGRHPPRARPTGRHRDRGEPAHSTETIDPEAGHVAEQPQLRRRDRTGLAAALRLRGRVATRLERGRRAARGCRLDGAHDRRRGVLVHAVGLADLDVDQAGRGERAARTPPGSARRRRIRSTAACRARVASSMPGSAITSETARRPPGAARARPRAAPRRLSPERLITQFEITTSTVASASGISSMCPCTNSTFAAPAAAAFARASASISSVMSSPIALPVGPTRRALISTSAPAPEPRSSTVSPSCRSATAVGTPQPSDAATASRGAPSASRP